MKALTAAIMAGFILFSFQSADASNNGTADEAQALVDKAIAAIAADREKAFVAIDSKDGEFVDRDLYIFVMDLKGNMLAHGANKGLIGKNLVEMKLKDPDGKRFIDEFVQVVRTKGEGWIDYKWASPTTKKIMQKSSFVKKIENDMFVGCGIYK